MNFLLKIILLLVFFNINYSLSQYRNKVEVYLIKTSWHVGITIPVSSTTKEYLPILNLFEKYSYVDIGWGDEKYYQDPDVNILLGLQALIIPTSSVIRVFGFTSNINNYISISDFTVSLQLSKSQFRKLLKFINQSLVQSPEGNFVITSKKIDGQIIFFRSKLKYFLLRTCNTWVAEALSFAGFKIRKTRIITARQLYKELIKIGKVEKILE